jgi:hypothetical protein
MDAGPQNYRHDICAYRTDVDNNRACVTGG